MLLKISRIHDMAKLPSRANPSDAGADVFYCPKYDPSNFKHVRIDPGDSVVLLRQQASCQPARAGLGRQHPGLPLQSAPESRNRN